MKNRSALTDAETRIVRLLRDEAAAEVPDFSPVLHARIMQAVAQQSGVTPATTARESGQAKWPQAARWAMSLAAVLLVFFSVWRPTGFQRSATPDEAVAPMKDTVADALNELSGTASLASDQIVEIVVDQSLIDRHRDFWNNSKQSIGDALLDPLPISWQSSVAMQEDQGI
jgi:hypothetical protein